MPSFGTRQRVQGQRERPSQGAPNGSFTRDVGMSKNITASVTFTFGNARVTGANGLFAAFAYNDPIEITGTHSQNGFYTVIGVDAVNASFLVLDPGPSSTGAVTATIRTP